MNGLVPALLLGLLSAGAYAAAAVLQERVADGSPAGALLGQRRGRAALALNGLGAGLHVVALQFGTLTLVQALGALTVVLAVPMGAAANGRGPTRREWRGAAVTGAALSALAATLAAGSSARTLGLTSSLALIGAVALALWLLRIAPGSSGLRLAASAGIAFAAGSAFTQTVSVALTDRGPTALASAGVLLPALCVIPLSVAGMLLSQAAYRDGLGAQLATLTLVNPAVSAVIGVTLLGEGLRGDGPLWPLIALAATALAARGVVLLTAPRPPAVTLPHPVRGRFRTAVAEPAQASAATAA